MQLPTWANVTGLTLALGLVACRDAPDPTLKIASSGAQTPTRVVQAHRSPVRSASEVSDLLNVRPGQVIRIYVERDSQITFTDLVFR